MWVVEEEKEEVKEEVREWKRSERRHGEKEMAEEGIWGINKETNFKGSAEIWHCMWCAKSVLWWVKSVLK